MAYKGSSGFEENTLPIGDPVSAVIDTEQLAAILEESRRFANNFPPYMKPMMGIG